MIIVNALTGCDIDIALPVEYTVYKVQTTSSYKKTGIYSAERNDATQPITIDWGDGNVEQVDGNISQKVHEYATEGEFDVSVYNIKTFVACANTSTWLNVTSQNRYTLKEVVLGTGITGIIWQYAFQNCKGLTSITIPNGVTSIENDVFNGCSDLTSITIPSSVTSIGFGAFQGCTALTSVTIPNGVTVIGGRVFNGCSDLASVTIPSSVTSILDDAFNSCTGLTSITIPDSVTSIGERVFQNCTGLTNISISNNVMRIEMYAFQNCSSLTSITIPNSVTRIGESAFQNCTDLTSVTIPSSVTRIAESAFQNCTDLMELNCSECTKVPALSNTSALSDTNANLRIVVPDALYSTWRTATNWSTYASRIVKASEV